MVLTRENTKVGFKSDLLCSESPQTKAGGGKERRTRQQPFCSRCSTVMERRWGQLWQPVCLSAAHQPARFLPVCRRLMHRAELGSRSFTAACMSLIGHVNICKPWRKSMVEGRNSSNRLTACFTAEGRVTRRSEHLQPSGAFEQLESSLLNDSANAGLQV